MNYPLVYILQTQAQKCKNICQTIDLYGINPNLLIFGNQKYSSILGSLLTIIASALTCGYLAQEVQELVQRSLPQTIISENLVNETSPFALTNENFTLTISVANMEQNPLKTIDKYFTIKVENCIRTRKFNTTSSKIDVTNTCITYPTEACTPENFVTDLQKEYFKKIRLGTVQCIKKDVLQNTPPILQGIASGNIYSYISIKFQACKNSTEKQDCASQDQINKELINGYYLVHMSDSLIQMSNPQSMQQNFIKMQFTQFSITTSKTIYQGFRVIQSMTDDGVLINNVKEDLFLVQQYYQESNAGYNEDYLVLHTLILDNKYTSYQRSYIKLLTILSKIGGLWQLIFIIFGIISKPFIISEMKINLANKLFRFQQEENDLTQSIKKEGSIKQNLEKLVQKPYQKLPNSVLSIISFLFGCNKARIKQLDQANKKIQQSLDIVEIMRRFQEFDNLKQILFSVNQRILFDLIPIPLITSQQQKLIESNQLSNQHHSKDNFERFLEAYKSFFQIRDFSEIPENIGQKIITLLDSDLIKLFYEYHLDSEQKQVFQFQSEERKTKIGVDRNYLDFESKLSLSPCNSNHQEAQAVRIFLNNQSIKRNLQNLKT